MTRNRIALLALTALAAAVAIPAHAAVPVWGDSVIVHAGFGARPNQFGRAGIGDSDKTIRLVSCFAASSRYIAVHDRIKRDVKIYTPGGAFVIAFPLRLTDGERPDTVRARDLALDGDLLYVLVDENDGGKSIPATMRVAWFDVPTGLGLGSERVETARLGPPGGRASARGPDAFLLHTDGSHLWIFDTLRQLSFQVVPQGPSHLGDHPEFGWGGVDRVATDDNASTINLLDANGGTTRRIPEAGVLVAVSETGEVFAALQTSGGANWEISVFNAQGDHIGEAPRPNRSWRPFKAPVMERKYELVKTADGADLYELYANAGGVFVVRWAP